MTSDRWLGIPLLECERLATRVAATPHDPREVIAAAASSVVTEPGDRIWGDCIAHAGLLHTLEALIESTSAIEFSRRIDVQPDDALVAGWRRWTTRLSMHATTQALEHAANVGARVILPSDAAWPNGLYDLGPHMPQVLYARGTLTPEWSMAIAIVGARAATGYGEHVTTEISGELAASGVLIISGAAYGIDGIAHRTALAEQQPTIAFLAGGIDRLYPSGHSDLLGQIAATGLVLSEMPCGSVPSKFRFLLRNRLIAAASRATVVIEAGRRSGSLNTAHHAATLGRPLGAVPGPITSPASTGCHHLLREGAAECVTSAAEVRELVWGPIESPGEDASLCG